MSEEEYAEHKIKIKKKRFMQRRQIRAELANRIAHPDDQVQPEVQEEANHKIPNHISNNEEDSKPEATSIIEVK